jgi:transcriptional repressor NrdR
MHCPFCEASETHVVDTRLTEQGAVRRRRRCGACERRFTTYERHDQGPLYIRKRGGGREPFDRAKLLAGLERAAIKRPVERDQLEALVDRIVAELRSRGGVPESELVGELALRGMRDLDAVAYVRFASVYRKFADVAEFERELERLESELTLQHESLFAPSLDPSQETPGNGARKGGSVRTERQTMELPRKAGGARRAAPSATDHEG